MNARQQIEQDIQTLSPEALTLVAQFIQLLQRMNPNLHNLNPPPQNSPPITAVAITEKTTYEQFQDSGLIGCVAIDENLSTTYKQVLAEEWGKKYDHR
ncbi:MAG: hypothetical protein RLZZ511_2327 [Cyanobacteriota bacterium]|jgi:hypothetical protein